MHKSGNSTEFNPQPYRNNLTRLNKVFSAEVDAALGKTLIDAHPLL